jgi:hypothetical protein
MRRLGNLELAFVTLGAILVTYGWYWGGVTEARTSAYAMGTGSIILGLFAAFTPAAVPAWTLFAVGAMWGMLATANAWNESAQDRTYGMFALFFAVAALLGVAADNEAAGEMTDYGLGALVVAVVMLLHFIAAALVPANKGFKALVGWVTLIGGAFLAFIGFAESIGSSIL